MVGRNGGLGFWCGGEWRESRVFGWLLEMSGFCRVFGNGDDGPGSVRWASTDRC